MKYFFSYTEFFTSQIWDVLLHPALREEFPCPKEALLPGGTCGTHRWGALSGAALLCCAEGVQV